MARRVRSALVWDAASPPLVGVLAQGAVLLGLGTDASFEVVVVVAVASDAAVASVTYVIELRLERKGRA